MIKKIVGTGLLYLLNVVSSLLQLLTDDSEEETAPLSDAAVPSPMSASSSTDSDEQGHQAGGRDRGCGRGRGRVIGAGDGSLVLEPDWVRTGDAAP